MRTLTWDGYPNVRDLGGLPTACSPSGATVPGRVARGPRRELMTAAGWDGARGWGLRTVVDLRCAYEVGPRPEDPAVDASAWDGVALVAAPAEDHDDERFREACFPILDSPAYWPHHWRLQPHLLRGVLEAVADAEPGVLVHCSAGRDRTGMITALLLANAGVAPEVVGQDYALSVRAMAGSGPVTPTADRQSGWDEPAVTAWLATATPLVEQAAADVGAVLDALGVDDGVRGRLRDLLTAP